MVFDVIKELFSTGKDNTYDKIEFDFSRKDASKTPRVESYLENSDSPIRDYVEEFGYGSRSEIVSLAEFIGVNEDKAFSEISRTMAEVSDSAVHGFEFDENPKLDRLSGEGFEEYLKDLFGANGLKVEKTQSSGDQGADLIIEQHNKKKVIQAKNYSSNVGNSAVQEVKAAIKHYEADNGIVISTSGYTKSAKKLAKSNDIELWDKSELSKVIEGEKNVQAIRSIRKALKAIEKSKANDNFINIYIENHFIGGFTWDDRLYFSNPITESNVSKNDIESPIEFEKARLESYLEKEQFEKVDSYNKLNKKRLFYRKNAGKIHETDDIFYITISENYSEIEKFLYRYIVDYCEKSPRQLNLELNV